MKDVLREKISGLLGLRMFRRRIGADLLLDIDRIGCGWDIETVFDVGANVGRVSRKYAKKFRNASVHSFEPVGSTFEVLKRNVSRLDNCVPHNMALGRGTSRVLMTAETDSVLNRIVEEGAHSTTEEVEVSSIDLVMEQLEISSVSLVKIDTEGHDLEVLMGARQALQDQRIDLIQVEASVNIQNDYHVYLNDFLDFLLPFGYRVFGFYNQVAEFYTGETHLRRADVAFISGDLSSRNKIAV